MVRQFQFCVKSDPLSLCYQSVQDMEIKQFQLHSCMSCVAIVGVKHDVLQWLSYSCLLDK